MQGKRVDAARRRGGLDESVNCFPILRGSLRILLRVIPWLDLTLDVLAHHHRAAASVRCCRGLHKLAHPSAVLRVYTRWHVVAWLACAGLAVGTTQA